MSDWKQELGKRMLHHGALSYIITNDNEKVDWERDGQYKPQIDMVVFYRDHIQVIELKETNSMSHRKVRANQVERYYYFCKDTKYNTQFWVYMYWKRFRTIVGAPVNQNDTMKFFVTKNDGHVDFWYSNGNERKRVEFRLKV